MSDNLMRAYAPMPVSFERGEGAWLWDTDGNRYLDAISGLGVCSLGHAHPELAAVIADQARRLIHTANLGRIPWQETLARKLCEISAMERAFIANSGAEAIECALKIVRLVGHARGIALPRVVVAEHSFHGRTMASLSAGGSHKAQAGFEPLMDGFLRVPYGDLEAVEQQTADCRDQVMAVLVEPIQGEAGVRVPPAGYLQGLRALCDRHGWLLILDEIQSGLCRTGYWYAHQHEQIVADIITTAKALANGLPVAACLARGEAAEAISPGRHGSTFGGNPLVCRSACKVLEIMAREEIAKRAATHGNALLAAFRERLGNEPGVLDIRGRGLMIGIELDRPAQPVQNLALSHGLLVNATADTVIRLLPPLIIDKDQATQIVDTVVQCVKET